MHISDLINSDHLQRDLSENKRVSDTEVTSNIVQDVYDKKACPPQSCLLQLGGNYRLLKVAIRLAKNTGACVRACENYY